ncbi:hypothetical protein KKD37_03335 [Patescibacteria group bacterium]|nr:hypothetical protein [Patescibacteria group bacterium]
MSTPSAEHNRPEVLTPKQLSQKLLDNLWEMNHSQQNDDREKLATAMLEHGRIMAQITESGPGKIIEVIDQDIYETTQDEIDARNRTFNHISKTQEELEKNLLKNCKSDQFNPNWQKEPASNTYDQMIRKTIPRAAEKAAEIASKVIQEQKTAAQNNQTFYQGRLALLNQARGSCMSAFVQSVESRTNSE